MSSNYPGRPALRITNPDSAAHNRDTRKNVHFLDEYPISNNKPSAGPYSYSPPNSTPLGGAEQLWRSEHRDWFFAGERQRPRAEEMGALRRHPAESPILHRERGMGNLQRTNEPPSLAYTPPVRDDIPHPFSFRGDSPVLPVESVRITTRREVSLDDLEHQENRRPTYILDEDDGQKYGQSEPYSDDGFRATLNRAASRERLGTLQKPLPPIPGKDPPSPEVSFIEDRPSAIPEKPPFLGSFDFEDSLDLFSSESGQSSHILSPPASKIGPLSLSPVRDSRSLFEQNFRSPPQSPESEGASLRFGTIEENRPLLRSIPHADRHRETIPTRSEDLSRIPPIYKESSTQTCDFLDPPRRRSEDGRAPRTGYQLHGVQDAYDIHPLTHLHVAEDTRFEPTLDGPPYSPEDHERLHTYRIDQSHRASQSRGIGAPYGIPATPAQQFSSSPSHLVLDYSSNASAVGNSGGRGTSTLEPPQADRRRRKSVSAMDYLTPGYPDPRVTRRSSISSQHNARVGPYGVAGFQSLSSTALPAVPLRARKGSVSTTEASPPTPPDDVRSLISDSSDNPFSDRHRTNNRHGRNTRNQHGQPRPKESHRQLKVLQEDSEEIETSCSNPEVKVWNKMKRWSAGLKHKLKKSKGPKEVEAE